MMTINSEPLGYGEIIWLGINTKKGTFSEEVESVAIDNNGIVGDMYNTEWRPLNGHDGDYIQADGLRRGDLVRNMRPITIVEQMEVGAASRLARLPIMPGMLRENMVVRLRFTPGNYLTFSKLPALSRIVLEGTGLKVLCLTEENGPCSTITNPIAQFYDKDKAMSDKLKAALKGRRGQLVMVRSFETIRVKVGDKFTIMPPIK